MTKTVYTLNKKAYEKRQMLISLRHLFVEFNTLKQKQSCTELWKIGLLYK